MVFEAGEVCFKFLLHHLKDVEPWSHSLIFLIFNFPFQFLKLISEVVGGFLLLLHCGARENVERVQRPCLGPADETHCYAHCLTT